MSPISIPIDPNKTYPVKIMRGNHCFAIIELEGSELLAESNPARDRYICKQYT